MFLPTVFVIYSRYNSFTKETSHKKQYESLVCVVRKETKTRKHFFRPHIFCRGFLMESKYSTLAVMRSGIFVILMFFVFLSYDSCLHRNFLWWLSCSLRSMFSIFYHLRALINRRISLHKLYINDRSVMFLFFSNKVRINVRILNSILDV